MKKSGFDWTLYNMFSDLEDCSVAPPDTYALMRQRPKIDSLPTDVDRVIIRDNAVVVILLDGSKGVSVWDGTGDFDAYVGFTIAYYKAKNQKSFKLKQVLDSCITSAKKKEYKQAILKNYKDK